MAADTEHGRPARDAIAICRSGSPRGDRLDQIGVEQERRALQDRRGDVRLIVGERMHHRRRRVLAAGENLGERAANQRRRIVEQHDHGAFGGGPIVLGEIRIEEGAGQRAGGFGAIAGGGGAQPVQELTYDHDKPAEPSAALLHRQVAA